MTSRFKRNIFFVLIFLIIVAFIFLIHFIGIEKIIEKIGVNNIYIIVFLTAFLGGASSFSSTSYFFFLITLAINGLNPFLLGLIGGTGLTLSDPLFFYFGIHGRSFVSQNKKIKNLIVYLTEWIKKKPKWVIPVFIFLYSGFTLLPSDILSFSLALLHYPFKKFIFFIFLANVNFAILISLFSFFFY
ncbi:hypothetical protein JW698_03390 [Candidatus Wolfebacteria bacterium]|nr:hypothetical protein [Candidatus Wolfebacteria bacterium]